MGSTNKNTYYPPTSCLKFIDFIKTRVNKRSKLVYYLNLKEYSTFYTKYFPRNYTNENSKSQLTKNSEISLYDCLEMFSSEEKLEEDNTWYCNVCKKHQEATKKLQIYKLPVYLIVCLKRFKAKQSNSIMNFMSSKKNEVTIVYPLQLDLSSYVVGHENDNTMYELTGISQHYGGLSSGHYTALCKNNGLWVEFDDETVSKVHSKEVVNNAAYILFYKRIIKE